MTKARGALSVHACVQEASRHLGRKRAWVLGHAYYKKAIGFSMSSSAAGGKRGRIGLFRVDAPLLGSPALVHNSA